MEKREVYCLECNYFGHSKTEHLEQMRKEYEPDEEFKRKYWTTSDYIPNPEITKDEGRLFFFGDVMWPREKRGKGGSQFDFEGNIHHFNGDPIPIKEYEEHIIKEGPNGTTKQYDT